MSPTVRPVRAARRGGVFVAVVLVAATLAGVAAVGAAPERGVGAATAGSAAKGRSHAPLGIDKTVTVVDGPNAGSTTDHAGPGDTLEWKVTFDNDDAVGGKGVKITDEIAPGQTFVPGSLEVPGEWTPKWAGGANPGSDLANYAAAEPGSVTGIAATHPTNGWPTVTGGDADFQYPANSFHGNTQAGDGYAALFYGGNIYNVHHHRPAKDLIPGSTLTLIECHVKVTGDVCPGWGAAGSYFSPTPGAAIDTGSDLYSTPMSPAGTVNRTTGRLYFPATTTVSAGSTNTSGVGCIDLKTDTSCGFTTLRTDSGQADIPNPNQWYPDGNGPGVMGDRMFMTHVDGTLDCFDTSTEAACPGYPVTVGVLGNRPVASGVEVVGTRVYTVGYPGYGGPAGFGCFDTVAMVACAGWPVFLSPGPNTFSVPNGFPLLDTSGAPSGACFETWNWAPTGGGGTAIMHCFDLGGTPVTPPAWNLPIPGDYYVGLGANFSPLLIGTRLYTASVHGPPGAGAAGGVTTYQCWDFASESPCAGFTPLSTGRSTNAYSLREDPYNPGCIWEVGDNGDFEVFSATTGQEGCPSTTGTVKATPAEAYCDSSDPVIQGWDQLRIGNLSSNDYSGAFITLRGVDGSIVPGFDDLNVTAQAQSGGGVDLSSLAVSGNTATLTASLRLVMTDVTAFDADPKPYLNLTWSGDPMEVCFKTRPPVTCDDDTIANEAVLGFVGQDDSVLTETAYAGLAYDKTAAGCSPGISIVKSTNGQDANEPPGPYIAVGDPVRWTYLVKNTGDAVLTDVTVTDDKLDASKIHCPDDGNTDNVVNTLAVGASVTCTADGIAVAGQYANTGSVVGTPPPTSGDDPVKDDDPSHYFGSDPDVDIVKSTNGEDADDEPGVNVAVGDPIEWTYLVTNTGNVTLTEVTITDDKIDASQIHCPDDGNIDNVVDSLDPGDSVTCTANGVAEAGQYGNVGTVTGTPPETTDTDGNPKPPKTVTDDDPSHYFAAPPAELPLTGSGLVIPLTVVGFSSAALGALLLTARRRRSRLS